MLVLVVAADDGLVGFNLTGQRAVEAFDLHRESDAVRNEPRGLLRDAQVAGELVRAAPLLRRVEPDGRQPLREGDRAVLEDRPLLDAELLAALLAAPQRAGPDEADLVGVADDAVDSVRPAKASEEVPADGLVTEVADGL